MPENTHQARENAAAAKADHAQGVAERFGREYPNPYAERPAAPPREREPQAAAPPSAKSLTEAAEREREIVGRDRRGDPILPQPWPVDHEHEHERSR